MTLRQSNIVQDKLQAAPGITGKLGSLITRLAENKTELRKAQGVRYKVFCEELSAKKNTHSITRLEQEKHDHICDHLLVLETGESGNQKIVGTQRFLVKSASDKHLEFRSQSEFDLETLADKHPEKNFMELGRSCILKEHRSKRTMELMWHGTWAYAVQRKVDVMTGCASFYAKKPEDISLALGFLSTLTSKDDKWQLNPNTVDATSLRQFASQTIDPKKAIKSLPPLIKGYLRLGAYFSDHAVIDEEFGTIDVAVILPVEDINPRYVNYYGADASKHNKI